MSCDTNWSIRFLDVNESHQEPFEVRPISLSLKLSRHEYDFCRAKLPWEVGEMMKPHTRYSDGKLYGYTKVLLCYNGTPIQPLAFRPDWVDYGTEYTHIQFHDLHKSLNEGVIDEHRDSVELKEIYKTVVDAASNNLITDIDFTLPDSQVRTIHGGSIWTGVDSVLTQSDPELDQETSVPDGIDSDITNDDYSITDAIPWTNSEAREAIQDQSARILSSATAVSFNEISPELALRRLNKLFRLKSWVNRDGVLIVGLPEAKSRRHIAAPDDERVWRYKDPSISHGREPVKSVIVKGSWVDEPGLDFDVLGWFDKGGTADVRAMGVGVRQDVDYGSRFTVKSTNAKRDALPEVAQLALEERMKQQNAGTVEIDPEISGEEASSLIDVEPGDLLHLVPDDDFFSNPTATSGVVGDSPPDPDNVCGDFVHNEVYLVSEVEHSVTEQGDWQVHLDLGMKADVEIESFMSYFDPESETWVDDSEIGDDGELKGGIFEIEDI